MLLRNIFEDLSRTGQGKSAVVGWGRGMGHKGHMFLASSVITQAKETSADPYFVVSKTVGKDDPINPDEKLAIYKKVFPQSGHIFQTATDEMPDLTRVLTKLNQMGYTDVTIVVGADQVKGLSYVKQYNGKPDKAGNIPFSFDTLNVISRQETNDPSRDQEGPRATPMRAVLMDPAKSEEEKFAVWRDSMNPELSDEEVMDLMHKAEQRMKATGKPKKKAMAEGLNEFAMSGDDDDEDPFDNYPCYDCGSTIFLHHTKLCELAEPNAKHDLPSNPGSQHWTGEIPKGLHTIPGLQEDDSSAIAHTAKSLENPPKVMQHRAKRDQERERQWMGSQIAKNDKTSKDEWGDLKQECAGVGTITKQNSTVDVNKNTPMKNLKAFKLAELSSEKLGQYKKAAGAQASAADKAGDTKKADKRFSGIVKATKKQFANDEKGVAEGLDSTPKITFAQQTPGSWTRIDILVNGDVKFQAVKTMGPGHWTIHDQDGEVIGSGGNKTQLKASVLDYLSKQGVAEGSRKQGTKMKGGVRVNNCVPVSEDVENIMDVLINKIIVNEAIQNKKR